MNAGEFLKRLSVGRALLIGVAIAAVYYFILYDSGGTVTTSINQLQNQNNELQKQIKLDQEKLDRAAVYKKAAAEIGTTIGKLLGVIPEHFGIPNLMKIISNEAKVAGSSLSGIVPGKAEISKVANEFEELSVAIDLSGTFLQHMIFLSNLTKINQILIVRQFNMTVTKEAKGEESPVLHMTADIVAFRYRGTAAIAADKAGIKKPTK